MSEHIILVSNKTGISMKMLNSFIKVFNMNNDRYQLLYGWCLTRAITFRQFKVLVRNVKIRSFDEFVYKGEPLFTDLRNNNSMPEDHMIGG